MQFKQLTYSPGRTGIVALILWILSSFVFVTPLMAVVLVVISAGAGIRRPGFSALGTIDSKNGTITWGLVDYLGLILFIVIITALVKGSNPIDLIKLIVPLLSGK